MGKYEKYKQKQEVKKKGGERIFMCMCVCVCDVVVIIVYYYDREKKRKNDRKREGEKGVLIKKEKKNFHPLFLLILSGGR